LWWLWQPRNCFVRFPNFARTIGLPDQQDHVIFDPVDPAILSGFLPQSGRPELVF
jgi:hypothetical protein